MREMTIGQWASMSPDYRGTDEQGLPFVVTVDPDSLATTHERVQLIAAPPVDRLAPPADLPLHYRGTWPLDPRD